MPEPSALGQLPKRTHSENLTIAGKANTQQGFSLKDNEKTVGPKANHKVVKNASFFSRPIQKKVKFSTIYTKCSML